MSDEPTAPRARAPLQLRALDDANRAGAVAFVHTHTDRPGSLAFEAWRYRDCPTMEALIAMAGDECVATMFGMRRTWLTPAGPRECLEPFEWHASEEWRAQAPGLRIVKRRMGEPRPMIAVAGTDMAADLLLRLKWTRVGTATKFALPLSGAYLAQRGRGTIVARAFDVLGRPFFTPGRVRGSALVIEPADTYSPALAALASRQRRFALMRLPDSLTLDWLHRAPASVGHYVTFHARVGDSLAGWATGRVFTHGAVRAAEILEVFLADEHRDHYPALLRELSATLAGFGADVLLATTTCPDTMLALRGLRFRIDDERPVIAWWGSEPVPPGPVLVDGAISDHAFFPVPPHSSAAWLEGADA